MKVSFSILKTSLLIASLFLFAGQSTAAPKTKKVLFFSKSSGFEHSTIKEANGQPSFTEKVLMELGPKNNIEFTFSKDGSLFTPEYLAKFDAYFFYTTGDLTERGTDGNPPMSKEGKAAFLDAIRHGKGFIGTHSAADTFHSPGGKEMARPAIKMTATTPTNTSRCSAANSSSTARNSPATCCAWIKNSPA